VTEILNHIRWGGGIPLVFIHAFPLSQIMWEGELKFFERNFQPISMDLPGFGTSPLRGEETSMESAAEDIEKLLNELVPHEKAVLCGLSMGGYVLFEFMRKHADRARALVLASTRAAADTPEAKANRFNMIRQVESKGASAAVELMIPKLLGKTALQNRPELTEKVRGMILKNTPEGITAALRGMANRRGSTDLLPQIKCPVLILAGEEDALIPPEEARSMKEKLPDGRLAVIPKAGHLLNLEQHEEFDKAVINFLKAKVL
jgi:3-oxoadipate enol-lactonase